MFHLCVIGASPEDRSLAAAPTTRRRILTRPADAGTRACKIK
jgi:hypothetical protein